MPESYEWYSPSEIRFHRKEVLWLIRNLSIISSGFWPPSHRETGYAGGPKTKSSHHAAFETPECIAGELEHRLESCGIDGLLLEFLVCMEDDGIYLKQKMANYMHCDIKEIDYRVGLCLRYICGFYRRQISYPRFVLYTRQRDAQRRSRASIRPAPVYSAIPNPSRR